jgi:hypothetical protein
MASAINPLPLGMRRVVAHGDGRTLLSVQGNSLVTAGSPHGHGPVCYAKVDEAGNVRVEADAGDTTDAHATAIALAHRGTHAAVAEPTHNFVGLFTFGGSPPSVTLQSVAYSGSTNNRAMAFTMDDDLL